MEEAARRAEKVKTLMSQQPEICKEKRLTFYDASAQGCQQ